MNRGTSECRVWGMRSYTAHHGAATWYVVQTACWLSWDGTYRATWSSATDRLTGRMFPEGPTEVPGTSEGEESLKTLLILLIHMWSKSADPQSAGGLSVDQLFPHYSGGRCHQQPGAALCSGGKCSPWSDHVAPLLTSCPSQAACFFSCEMEITTVLCRVCS